MKRKNLCLGNPLKNSKDSIFKTIIKKDGCTTYYEDFLNEVEANQLFSAFKKKTRWSKDEIKIFGKKVFIPRHQAWYGDPGANYKYSNLILKPIPWFKELKSLKDNVEKITGENFNSCLMNFYETGADYSAWHADNEKELGKNPTIASISLGGLRNFQIRHKATKETVKIDLANGSLLLMKDELQHHWIHQISKTKKKVMPRINITFRLIKDLKI